MRRIQSIWWRNIYGRQTKRSNVCELLVSFARHVAVDEQKARCDAYGIPNLFDWGQYWRIRFMVKRYFLSIEHESMMVVCSERIVMIPTLIKIFYDFHHMISTSVWIVVRIVVLQHQYTYIYTCIRATSWSNWFLFCSFEPIVDSFHILILLNTSTRNLAGINRIEKENTEIALQGFVVRPLLGITKAGCRISRIPILIWFAVRSGFVQKQSGTRSCHRCFSTVAMVCAYKRCCFVSTYQITINLLWVFVTCFSGYTRSEMQCIRIISCILCVIHTKLHAIVILQVHTINACRMPNEMSMWQIWAPNWLSDLTFFLIGRTRNVQWAALMDWESGKHGNLFTECWYESRRKWWLAMLTNKIFVFSS